MDAVTVATPKSPNASSSLSQKLSNLFASPGEVFDEVAVMPSQLANWRIPTLLVCLAGVVFTLLFPAGGQKGAYLLQLAQSGAISTVQAEFLAGAWPLASSLAVCSAAFGGSLWSALVL